MNSETVYLYDTRDKMSHVLVSNYENLNNQNYMKIYNIKFLQNNLF